MQNLNISKIFHEIAEYLEMEEVAFKPYAYHRVAVALENLKEDVGEIYEKGGLKRIKKIPGVGKAIGLNIVEYIKTGKIDYYEKLKKKSPVNLGELTSVEGLGPKRIKILYKKLDIKNVKELERAVKLHKIAPLFGFGEKTEENLSEAIKFFKKAKGRILLGEILPIAKDFYKKLKNLRWVNEITIVGSLRRKKETIGDVDFLVSSKNPKKVMDFFVSMPGIEKVWGKGSTKSSIRIKEGFDIDVRIVSQKSYGSALQYFTGSKAHNIATRKIAMSKGLKLNEYGLFRGTKMIAGENEASLYRALKMKWIPPELREDQGEIEASLKDNLPQLIEQKDIKGDLHCHSGWNGGKHTILEMAEEAMQIGYSYLGISDHTKFLKIENGLDEKKLSLQRKEINKLNLKLKSKKFKVLQGAEVNILKNGLLDIKDVALKKLDYVIAGVHSSLKMPKDKMTERIIRAMKNPYIKIIAHPTGRVLKKRERYQLDFDKILRAAKEFKVILEINSSPVRLDLNDQYIRACKDFGVKMVINTDAHRKEQLNWLEFGVGQARRGWAEKTDIINTHPLSQLIKFFK